MSMDALDDPVAWVAGQPAADPVRQRVLQALARRAAAQAPGALRTRLVATLVQRAQAAVVAPSAPRPANAPSPLTALVAQLNAAGTELRNVHAHERTWRTLRLSRRMAEVSAPVPDHLGPLNSQVLVTRALQQLKGISPDYLQRLLTQLDTLAALAPLQAADTPADKPGRTAARKTPAKAAPKRR